MSRHIQCPSCAAMGWPRGCSEHDRSDEPASVRLRLQLHDPNITNDMIREIDNQ